MNLLAVSINHRTAPVELREALYLGNEDIKNLVSSAKEKLLSEGFLLCTCNRTELYGFPVDENTGYHDLQNFIIDKKSSFNINSEHFQSFLSREAVKHLFSVITGIDSLLIGDNQVFKQVKDSFQLSEEMSFAGFLMKRIFDYALIAGKRALTETEISEGAVTVSYAAVQLIEKIFSSLHKKSALVIGAGESGELAAKHLQDRGISSLTITNRTIEKAEKLAQSLNSKIIPFTNFKEHLHEFDIVISATSSPDLILTKADIKSSMKKRNNASLVLMDIAVPRDIDPDSKSLDYVFYHDIDSLNIIVEQNLTKRRAEIPKVEKIIEEEVDNLFNWYNSLQAAPTIKNLRDHFENIRLEEVEKNKNKFSSEDQEKLDIVTKRIINKILHQPTIELRKSAETGENTIESAARIGILRQLFGIDNHRQDEEKR
jgi:glutamyl-tRNA reductase